MKGVAHPILMALLLLAATGGSGAESPERGAAGSSFPLEAIRVSPDGKHFLRGADAGPFRIWGVNYDHDRDGRLLEDYWEEEWDTVEADFREIRSLGANCVRIHLQFGKFMDAPARPNERALGQLARLVSLAEKTGLYLDVTGLGCYHKRDVPKWYDSLDEEGRWSAQARFWEAVAKTCASSRAIFCYDLMNEPILPGAEPADGWLAGEFGGKHFVQRIALDLEGRTREEVAEAWVVRMVAAIRKHDADRLVTVGVIPWVFAFGGGQPLFYGPKIRRHLDFAAVHFYPEAGKVDEAIRALRAYEVGMPLVIEEMFPLKCGADELARFVERSADHADGWISFYWGQTARELRAKEAPSIADAVTAGWLEKFSELAAGRAEFRRGIRAESSGRGLVAVRDGDARVFTSWRLLPGDPPDVAFNLYRRDSAGSSARVNGQPIAGATNFVDESAGSNAGVEYSVRAVGDGAEGPPSAPAKAWASNGLEIPIAPVVGYLPGDASVADLDGDGEWEIVLHQVSRARDNAHSGLTGTPLLDAYELDGRHLWRIDLGRNIREGEHYTQFMVYDLDGDGAAELVCKTADGSVDGKGGVIGDATRDWRDLEEGSRSFGRVLRGPEFLTVFDGRTGAAMESLDYVPGRDPIDGWGGIGGNGGNDAYGNRCDRFLACVAYLDGERPSVVMCRGVYGRTVLAAWDWRDGALTRRWVFDSGISKPPYRDASPYSGMGGHSIGVADVDGDGRDEIVYQAMVVDDDGTGMHSSRLRHGDAMHVGDLVPQRPGLEIFTVQENEGGTVRFRTPGAALRDAKTGEILWSHSPGVDVTAGMAADIDPRHPGCEFWGGPGGLRNALGETLGLAPRTTGAAIWWDGDLLRELLGRDRISKWNWEEGREDLLVRLDGPRRARNPCLVADLLGDWREEVIVAAPDGRSLRLYTTTIPTAHRLVTLMHDRQYRLSIALQNVAYNQVPRPAFFIGEEPAGVPPRAEGR